MNNINISQNVLFIILCFSFLLCAFCAASEIGILSINRYRLKHLAKTNPNARRINKLLSKPDRLLGAILIGNIFATALGSSAANEIAGRNFGDIGVLLSPFVFTLLLLIFSESAPKTIAALKPEATAYFLSRPLKAMLFLFYPIVIFVTSLSNAFLRLFGVKLSQRPSDSLSTEELRTVVNEAGGLIPRHHQSMLLSILDLEKLKVDHIMVPRNEVIGIDLEDDEKALVQKLTHSNHTLLPVYRSDLDNVLGIFHTRNMAKVLTPTGFNEAALINTMDESYFIPEGTSLHTQLLNFQQNKKRMALVVDEYGDVLGLVTLEDILEEIVGEFTTGVSDSASEIQVQADGSFLVDGGISVRELNRLQNFEFPTEGPTTLNGLILETLESIPEQGICLKIAGYPIEVIQLKDNAVKTVRVSPRLSKQKSTSGL